MFDSQRLSFEKFILGYKHGIYVFTEDTCHICKEYKDSISFINNANLYFVEVSLETEKKLIEQMLGRSVFPLTACFKDNKLSYVKAGQLFETQLQGIFADLKKFGDKPLSPDEIQKRLKKEETKCLLAYYVFSNSITADERRQVIEKAIKYNELPIDVDSMPENLTLEDRFHMLEYTLSLAKLVIFKSSKSQLFSSLGQRIIIEYNSTHGTETKFDIRNISDILGQSNDRDNSN